MVLLLTAVALVVLGAVALGTSLKLEELVSEDKQRELFGSATGVILLATYVRVIGLTSEFRYGTIHPTLLIEPRRRVVLGAKLAASALVGLVFGVVGVACGSAPAV
jgi:hypothetical protein